MPGFETKPDWTEIRYRLASPNLCGKKYGRREITSGVSLLVCLKKGSTDNWMNQALRFAKSRFPTVAKARAWFNKNWKKKGKKAWDIFVEGNWEECDLKTLGFEIQEGEFECGCLEEDGIIIFEIENEAKIIINGDANWNSNTSGNVKGYEGITLSNGANQLQMEYGAKIITKFKCDKYACYVKEENGREVAYLHFKAVTTKESNKHRFPEKILERDIKTLEDKPFVDWHSEWPEKKLSNFDIIGRVVKAWYNKAKKLAEVVVKVWRKQIVELIKERKKNGKLLITHVSVGYKHKFHKEGNIRVSDRIEFHHLGYLPKADAADKEAEALPIDESLLSGVVGKAEDYTEYETEWTKEISEFVAEGKKMTEDDSKIVIMDKSSFQDLLNEHPAKVGDTAWLVFRQNDAEKYWYWEDVIVSESKPTDKFLLDFFYEGIYRMFKVGKSITDEGINHGRAKSLPKGYRDFKITKMIKSESTIKSAGSSTVEATNMDEKEQKKMEEDLAKAKEELEAKAKELETSKAELETAQAELKTKTEELETNESAVKEKSDALDAALKEKKDADTAKEEAEKAKKDAEVLLQQEKEKQLEVKVEELVKNGQIEASKKEDTLNLLKAADEEGQTKLLNVLETKAKAVPVGEEQGREEAEKELGADGLMPDAKADALAKEMYNVSYEELVKGVKSGGGEKK